MPKVKRPAGVNWNEVMFGGLHLLVVCCGCGHGVKVAARAVGRGMRGIDPLEAVEPRLICSRCRRKGCAIVLLDAEGQDVPYQMGRG